MSYAKKIDKRELQIHNDVIADQVHASLTQMYSIMPKKVSKSGREWMISLFKFVISWPSFVREGTTVKPSWFVPSRSSCLLVIGFCYQYVLLNQQKKKVLLACISAYMLHIWRSFLLGKIIGSNTNPYQATSLQGPPVQRLHMRLNNPEDNMPKGPLQP